MNEVIMFYNFSVVKSQVFLHRMMSRGGHALFFSWCAIAILFALFTDPYTLYCAFVDLAVYLPLPSLVLPRIF